MTATCRDLPAHLLNHVPCRIGTAAGLTWTGDLLHGPISSMVSGPTRVGEEYRRVFHMNDEKSELPARARAKALRARYATTATHPSLRCRRWATSACESSSKTLNRRT